MSGQRRPAAATAAGERRPGVPMASGPRPSLPKTRVGGPEVLRLPSVGPSAEFSPDRRWGFPLSYDEIASGSTEFISRDPLVAQTRSAYGYVHDNPLNARDPSGLDCGWTSPWDCVGDAASAGWNWAQSSFDLPNSRWLTGGLNLLYGTVKIGSGVFLVTIGTAEDLTGIGALLGIPTQAFGLYQLVTGGARLVRGFGQLRSAYGMPTECKTPFEYGADIGLDLAPGGGEFENFFGGLP